MRNLLSIALVLLAGEAAAQAIGSCTFTYNSIAKRVESKCQGIPGVGLPGDAQLALITGKYQACTVEVVSSGPKTITPQPPVCK